MAVDVAFRFTGYCGSLGGEGDKLLTTRGGTNCPTLRMQRLPYLLAPLDRHRPLRRGEFGAAEVFVDLDQFLFEEADFLAEFDGVNRLPAETAACFATLKKPPINCLNFISRHKQHHATY